MSEDTDNVQRSLGRIEGRLDSQDADRALLRVDIQAQGEKLDTIVRYIERQKGSRRTLLTVGSALATACGALAGFAVEFFTSRHG